MSKERGQRNRDLFLGWVAEMKSKESPNWLDYWHGDTLSPKKIADELGFDSSAFKEKRNKIHDLYLKHLSKRPSKVFGQMFSDSSVCAQKGRAKRANRCYFPHRLGKKMPAYSLKAIWQQNKNNKS